MEFEGGYFYFGAVGVTEHEDGGETEEGEYILILSLKILLPHRSSLPMISENGNRGSLNDPLFLDKNVVCL